MTKVQQSTKVCATCNVELSIDLFGNRPKSKDGKRASCKKCTNEANKRSRGKPRISIEEAVRLTGHLQMSLGKSVVTSKSLNRFVTLEQDFHKVPNNKYSYEKAVFEGMLKLLTVTCPQHGTWEITADNHLRGKGCSACGAITAGEKQRYTTEKFVEEATKVHGDLYDYSTVDYSISTKPVQIKCRTHGSFDIVPSSHIMGVGCPYCGNILSNKKYWHLPATLYYVYLPDKNLFKLGVTTRKLKARFSGTGNNKIIVLGVQKYDTMKQALEVEQLQLLKYQSKRYCGEEQIFKYGMGDSELLVEDVYNKLQTTTLNLVKLEDYDE